MSFFAISPFYKPLQVPQPLRVRPSSENAHEHNSAGLALGEVAGLGFELRLPLSREAWDVLGGFGDVCDLQLEDPRQRCGMEWTRRINTASALVFWQDNSSLL